MHSRPSLPGPLGREAMGPDLRSDRQNECEIQSERGLMLIWNLRFRGEETKLTSVDAILYMCGTGNDRVRDWLTRQRGWETGRGRLARDFSVPPQEPSETSVRFQTGRGSIGYGAFPYSRKTLKALSVRNLLAQAYRDGRDALSCGRTFPDEPSYISLWAITKSGLRIVGDAPISLAPHAPGPTLKPIVRDIRDLARAE